MPLQEWSAEEFGFITLAKRRLGRGDIAAFSMYTRDKHQEG